MTRCNVFVAMLGLMVSSTLYAADAKVDVSARTFAVPQHGALALSIPHGWKEAIEQPPQPGFPTTLKLTTDGKKFIVLITPVPSTGEDADFNSPAKLRKLAEDRGGQMLATAKEQSLSIVEIKGDNTAGYYWTLTDKAPDPGSFEFATGAVVGVGDLILSVTILHHEKDVLERKAAIKMLQGASQKAPVAPTELRVAAPGGAWDLVLPVKGLERMDERGNRKGRIKQVSATDQKSGLIVSIFMEPSPKNGDSSTVREVYWGRAKKSPMQKTDIKLDKAGDYATVDYLVPEVAGEVMDQKNVNVYIAHEGMWIDVHLSKVQFTAKDQAMFDEAVKGIRFEKSAKGDPKPGALK